MSSGQVIAEYFANDADWYSALWLRRNRFPALKFDGATDQEALFHGVVSSYAGGGFTVDTWWWTTSATTGSFRVQCAFDRLDVAHDIDTDSFAAFQSAGGSAAASSGNPILVTVTFTHGAQIDSLLDGEPFAFLIRRDADGTSGTDDIATGLEWLAAVIRET